MCYNCGEVIVHDYYAVIDNNAFCDECADYFVGDAGMEDRLSRQEQQHIED